MAYWQWIAEEAGRNLSAVVNEAFRELRRLLQ
jgi:hypothetical protein